MGILGHQIYKFNGNLINLGVLIRKGANDIFGGIFIETMKTFGPDALDNMRSHVESIIKSSYVPGCALKSLSVEMKGKFVCLRVQ